MLQNVPDLFNVDPHVRRQELELLANGFQQRLAQGRNLDELQYVNTKERMFEDGVKSAEQAAVLVLVYLNRRSSRTSEEVRRTCDGAFAEAIKISIRGEVR